MPAIVKKRSERGMGLEDVPEPSYGINDVTICVKKTGVCGTGLHRDHGDAWAQKTICASLISGHEFAPSSRATGLAARAIGSAADAGTIWQDAGICVPTPWRLG